MEGLLRERGARLALLFLVGIACLIGIYLLRDIFAPLLLGFLIAYVLDPFADFLQRCRLSRLAAVIVIFTIATVIALALLVTSGYFITQGARSVYYRLVGDELVAKGAPGATRVKKTDEYYIDTNGNGRYDPGYLDRMQGIIAEMLGRKDEDLQKQWNEAIDQGRAWLVKQFTTDGHFDAQKLRNSELWSWVKSWWTIGPEGERSAGAAAVSKIFTVLSWLLFCPLYVFFFLLQFDPIIASLRGHLPGRHRERIAHIFSKIDHTLAAFFRGRLTICLVKGGITALGLLAFGVPFWLPLGLAAGFLSLIPYVGIYFAIVPALLLSWFEQGSWARLAGIGGMFLVVEMMEGFVLIPAFLGREIGLHPLTIIVTLLIFGRIFGLIGVLLSVPLAAITKILAQEFLLPLVNEFAREKPAESSQAPP